MSHLPCPCVNQDVFTPLRIYRISLWVRCTFTCAMPDRHGRVTDQHASSREENRPFRFTFNGFLKSRPARHQGEPHGKTAAAERKRRINGSSAGARAQKGSVVD